jgi:hypothetical protein
VSNDRYTHGITLPFGPFGISFCVKRWAIGGAIGLRKRLRRSK